MRIFEETLKSTLVPSGDVAKIIERSAIIQGVLSRCDPQINRRFIFLSKQGGAAKQADQQSEEKRSLHRQLFRNAAPIT